MSIDHVLVNNLSFASEELLQLKRHQFRLVPGNEIFAFQIHIEEIGKTHGACLLWSAEYQVTLKCVQKNKPKCHLVGF